MYRRYWNIGITKNGFSARFFVYGTEAEMIDYLNSEIGGGDERHTGNYSYFGATESEVAAGKSLGMKAYLAPQL